VPEKESKKLLSMIEDIAWIEKLDPNLKMQYMDTSKGKKWMLDV
jgi:hypothetical protein